MLRVLLPLALLVCVVSPSFVVAQDPAEGWMAYAVGTVPASTQRITRLEMSWTVGASPAAGYAFFSPWFGMDPDDNLNLIQPVNPWTGSDPWTYYTEYYQWDNSGNSNSDSGNVDAGQTLHGSLIYIPESDSYNLTQTVVETGATSQQIVACENGKKYRLPYVVYEKVFSCNSYPPDEVVTFRNIIIECDGKDCTNAVSWTPQVVDANCGMTAHVDKYPQEISITWSTTATSEIASRMTEEELFKYNTQKGWAKRLHEKGMLPIPESMKSKEKKVVMQ